MESVAIPYTKNHTKFIEETTEALDKIEIVYNTSVENPDSQGSVLVFRSEDRRLNSVVESVSKNTPISEVVKSFEKDHVS